MAKVTTRWGKIILISVFVTILVAGGFFVARYIIYNKIRNTIIGELRNLKTQGIDVQYDHIDIYPWSGKIELIGLTVSVRKEGEVRGLDASIPYVLVKGIQVLPFLKNKTLSLSQIIADQAAITYSKGAVVLKSSNKKRKIELREIYVDQIDLPGIDFYIREADHDTLAHILSNVKMSQIDLIKQLDSLTWRNGEIEVTEFAMRLFKDHYGISASRANVNISAHSLSVDSLRIQPTLGPAEYMLEKKEQATYIAGIIPMLRLEGINWFTWPQPILDVKKIALNFQFDMYRDKRLPFLRTEKRPLPAHFLHRLPVRISIDSVSISESFVSYEEFPEAGDSSGTVNFQKIRATILNIHNNPKMKKQSRMFAHADFMGAGSLNAYFTFPYDTLKPYRVSGTLDELPMGDLNNILGSTAQVKVESGFLRRLKFDFTYNDNESNGSVKVVYEDLKILALKNKDEQQAVNKFKSLLVNTIFIKKDVFGNISSDKRDGEIEFTRDKRKSVFNFWWKSILSGVKSAFYLDKLPLTSEKQSEKSKTKTKVKEVLSRIF